VSEGVVHQFLAFSAAERLSAEAAEGTASFLEKRKPLWYPQ
jgi:hypothetical protein